MVRKKKLLRKIPASPVVHNLLLQRNIKTLLVRLGRFDTRTPKNKRVRSRKKACCPHKKPIEDYKKN
jgi:hypothetical protein